MVKRSNGVYEPLPIGAPIEERVISMERAVCDIGNRQGDLDETQKGMRRFLFGDEYDPEDTGLKGEVSEIKANQDRNYNMQRYILYIGIALLLIMGPQGIEHLLQLVKVIKP